MGVFDGSIGAFVSGTLLSTFLLGVTATQAFNYYQNFGWADRKVYFFMVTGLLILDWAHTIVSCMTIYWWTVDDFGDVAKLVTSPWTFAVDPAMTGIAASVVQLFYAYRVYVVGKREKLIIPIIIAAFSIIHLAFACACTGMIFHLQYFSRFQTFTYGVSIWLGAAAFCDVLITGSLVYGLAQSRSGILQTNSVINRLIELVIQTNGLTAAVSIIDAVLFGVLTTSYHVTANLCLVKLYFNSLLVSLNARHELERHLQEPRLWDFSETSGNSGSNHSSPRTVWARRDSTKDTANTSKTSVDKPHMRVKISTQETVVTETIDKEEFDRYHPMAVSPRRPTTAEPAIVRPMDLEKGSVGSSQSVPRVYNPSA